MRSIRKALRNRTRRNAEDRMAEGQEPFLRLEERLRATRVLLDEVKAISERNSPIPFAHVLMQEKQRAERYDRSFSVVVLKPGRLDVFEALVCTAETLRASDVVGSVDSEGNYRPLRTRPAEEPGDGMQKLHEQGEIVAIILPETDRYGAECAATRLRNALIARDRVKVGVAAFPEDGTEPDALIRIAAA